MTETVIMLPVFILVWTGIIFVYQGYDRRIQVMQQTRAEAWSFAMNQCQGGSFSTSNYAVVSGISGLIATLGTPYRPDPVMEFTASRQTSIDSPEALGGETVQLSHRMNLMCDEKTQKLKWRVHAVAWAIFVLPEII